VTGFPRPGHRLGTGVGGSSTLAATSCSTSRGRMW